MFPNIYIRVFSAVIGDIVSKKYESSGVVDLVIEAICYIKRLKQQQLSEFIKEIENNPIDKEKWLTKEEKHWLENTQTEKLKELLANPKELAKCLDVLLCKADNILRVISIFGSELTNIPISKQSSKLRFKSDISKYIKTEQERNFLIDSCYNTSEAHPIYLPVFLIILRKLKINANRIDCENLSLSMDDADKINSYFKELHEKIDKGKEKATEYKLEQSGSDNSGSDDSESSLDEKIEIIQEPVKFSIICYPKLQDLIISCLEGNGQKIQENINTILDIAALNSSEFKKESLAFVFHAAMKALMLSGIEDNFDILLSAFRTGFAPEGLSVKELLGTELYKEILVVYDELGQNNIFDSYLDIVSESMDIHNLLKYATLLDKNNILCWMWENLITQSEQEPTQLLKRSIEKNTNILSYNRLEVIKWYQGKLQGCDNVVNRMTGLWKIGRDWGGGMYHKMLESNSISLALGLEDKYSPKDILELLYNTIQEDRSDEVWELIFDLAINSTDVNCLEQAFSTLPLKDDSYVYCRLVATAVIKNNMEMLEKFWEVIGRLENEELKNKIKKRALVDSTWAFHKALRDGSIEIMNWIWSKIDELPKEEVVGDYGYRCELLYGLDVYEFDKVSPIINAVISGKIKVLNWVYEKMGIVIDGMLGAEAVEEDIKRLDEIMVSSERRKGIINTLRQDYYHNENFGGLGYIPVLDSNSSYLEEISSCKYIKNKDKFIKNAEQVEDLLKGKSLEQPGPNTAKKSRHSDLDPPEQPRRSPSPVMSLIGEVEELNISFSPK